MLKQLVRWLKSSTYEVPQEPGSEVVITSCGARFVTASQMAQLQHHLTVGIYYREQVEAAAAECCRILGVNPNSDSVERDWASEIVLCGTDPQIVIEKINTRYRSLA
jgi:hypothetical protein